MMDDQHDDDLDTLEDIPISRAPLERLTRDMRQASATLSDTEARYLVDTYYAMQKNRIRANNQIRAMGDAGEPHEVLVWFAAQSDHLEKQVKAALQQYVLAHPAGKWAIAQKGIGPVIAAGIIARIDIRRAPTAGHIWSFAGLTNDAAWLGGEAARKAVLQFTGGNQSMDASDLIDIAGWVGASPKWLARRVYRQITDQEIPFRGADAESDADYVARQIDGLDVRLKHVVNALSKRPWNGPLKRILWLAGEAFTKVSNRDGAFYGHVFKERKAQEEARNRAGEFSGQARASLAGKNIGKDTDAYLWYAGCLTAEAAQTIANLDPGQRQGAAKRLAGAPGSGVEMLPPARLHLRAQRVAVKLFLSNLHEVWYFQEFDKLPPNPYPIEHLGHAHKIGVPGGDMIPGYLEARREHDRKGGA